MSEYHQLDIGEVALEFGTDLNVGRVNVDSNRKRMGANQILHAPIVDAKLIIRRISSDASLILLAGAYIIAAILGYYIEAVLAIMLLIASFITIIIIRKGEKCNP